MSDGTLAIDTNAPAGNFYKAGFRVSAAGALYGKDATAVDDLFIQGIRVSTLGQVIYELAAPQVFANGNPLLNDGQLCII